ncbi:MAG: hypothetical protein ACRD4B_11080, partial [Acidobacteriota bacterium]
MPLVTLLSLTRTQRQVVPAGPRGHGFQEALHIRRQPGLEGWSVYSDNGWLRQATVCLPGAGGLDSA